MIAEINGQEFSIQDKWLRVTHNPSAPRYPLSGQIIEIKNHSILGDGKYLVLMVEEFEPPYHTDEDGRDIRISLTAGNSHKDMNGLNGFNIRRAMTK